MTDQTDFLSLIKKKKSSEYNMNSNNNFQFMGVKNMDELLKNHTALELSEPTSIDTINKDIEAINHVLMGIDIPEEERKMLLFLIKDIIEVAKEAILGKEEKGK